ncbi:hypothetical protein RI543_003365 [Arxiozyma heterogenica]|uniref:Uncharacterized protein n=1 Tax=Arxiozyma heterogenica TaxID=278026 RepID=A0AAN7ZSB6_9SACH|nr:hypothetical protein RI543_003365 [Kazachstania heterogenica]
MSTTNYETFDQNISNISKLPKKNFPMRVVVNTYSRQMDDELDLVPGDKIHVITDDEEYNDGWYFGKNLNTGKMGLFPKNFTQVVDNKDSIMNKKSHRRNSSLINSTTTTTAINQNNLKTHNNDSFIFEENTKNNNNKSINNNYNQNLKSEMVVNTTMNDIDQALRALKNDSMDILGDLSSINTSHSGTIGSLTNTSFPNENTFKFPFNLKQTKGLSSLPISSLADPYNHITDSTFSQKDYTFDIRNLKQWSPNEIANYFIKKGIDIKTASLFEKHKINGSILLELELLHLKELDINSFGTRFTIFKIIEDLKEQLKKDFNHNILNTNSFKSQLSTSTINNNDTNIHDNDSLLPAASIPSVDNNNNNNNNHNNMNPREKLPNNHRVNSVASHSRKPSGISVNNQTLKLTSEKLAGLAISSNEHLFDSPGAAPKPPSYPSPVQPRLSPTVNKNVNMSPSINKYSSPREKYENKNRPPTKLENNYIRTNPEYKFGSLQRPSDLNNISENESLTTSLNAHKIKSSTKNVVRSTFNIPTTNFPVSSSTTPLPTSTTETNITSRYSKVYIHSNQTTSMEHRIPSYHKKSISGGSFIDLFSRISSMSPSRTDLLEDNESTMVPDRPNSVIYGHSRSSSGVPYHMRKSSQGLLDIKKHRRASSVLSFFSPTKVDTDQEVNFHGHGTISHSRKPSVINSPLKQEIKENVESSLNKTPKTKSYRHSMFVGNSATISTLATITPKKQELTSPKNISSSAGKRPKSELSTSHKAKQILRFSSSDKKKTSAFVEGIRNVTVEEAIKDASCYGWMYKKSSGTMGTWKKRFFTLHGTRLSYFGSLNDTKERGLIDITGHRVVPIKDDDRLIAFYATSTRSGKYIFKLLPPQPGSKKGLTFTQPRVHYFSVESKEDIRSWLSALIKASIDIDDTVPVISTYAMPTVSLNEAKQMLKEAKEEMTLRIQENAANEYDEGKHIWEEKRESLGRLSSNVL